MKLRLLILTMLGGLSAAAAPRDWTSADGRTINAEYLGRAPDGSALVLERTDTKARVTVPVVALAAADQEHAATLPTASVPEPAPAKPAGPSPALVALAGKWPSLGNNHADAANLRGRYEKDLAAILSGNPAQNCRALRIRIERDLPIVKNDTIATIGPDDQNTEKGRAKIAKVNAAKASIAWLNAVSAHCAKIEAEASQK